MDGKEIHFMRLSTSTLCVIVAAGLLAGCSGSNLSSQSASLPSNEPQQSHFRNGRFIPQWSWLASAVPIELRPSGPEATLQAIVRPLKKKRNGGIYASEFRGSSILGYSNPNRGNRGPTCSETGVASVNGVAVDGKGNLIDPDGGSRSVIVFAGPGMCGPKLGSVADPYGQPADAASVNAATGTIVVGNIFDTSGAGSISLCTLAGGCTVNLTNPNMYELAGVAQGIGGDCWASATNASGTATLTYFKGCSGAGQAATGYLNAHYGGLDIDASGHLVSISGLHHSKLYVYKGCKPACTRVGGPFKLHGEVVFGHLDQDSKQFVAGDSKTGEEDVYAYSPTSLHYSYSFNNGLVSSDTVEGAAFKPRSKQ